MQANYEQTEKLLATLIAEWGNALDSAPIDPVWARVLGDPFLRQLTCRYNLCFDLFGFLFHDNVYSNDGVLSAVFRSLILLNFAFFRFIFCRAVFGLHSKYRDKLEYMPRCRPPLPDELLPTSKVVETVIYLLASRLGVSDQFDCKPSSTKKADASNGSFKDETTTTGEDFSAGEASSEDYSDDRYSH